MKLSVIDRIADAIRELKLDGNEEIRQHVAEQIADALPLTVYGKIKFLQACARPEPRT